MKFSHVDEKGQAKMVDVSEKPDQTRLAIAQGKIKLATVTLEKIKQNEIAKGNVLTVAQIAGINAAKKTSELIPLCHPLFLSKVSVDFEMQADGITALASAKSIGKTGVEMEALIAASTALLTIYDMCKAVDKEMELGEIKLIEKKKI
ncbi:MAG: cyclic pyranopterin monophosphate synthase MoaC [Pseudomonadota bacterium]